MMIIKALLSEVEELTEILNLNPFHTTHPVFFFYK